MRNKELEIMLWLPEGSHSLAASSTHQLEPQTGKGSMRFQEYVCVWVVCVCVRVCVCVCVRIDVFRWFLHWANWAVSPQQLGAFRLRTDALGHKVCECVLISLCASAYLPQQACVSFSHSVCESLLLHAKMKTCVMCVCVDGMQAVGLSVVYLVVSRRH